jgi:hypothetical protein
MCIAAILFAGLLTVAHFLLTGGIKTAVITTGWEIMLGGFVIAFATYKIMRMFTRN